MTQLQVDSITMQDAIDRAFMNSSAYFESQLSVTKARIQFYQSLFNVLPALSATTTMATSEFNDVETSQCTNGLNATMPVFDLDVISAMFVTGGQLTGSKIQHRSDVAGLILRIKTAYYNLINGNELVRSSGIAIERAQKNYDLVKTKMDLGSASRLEMLQAEVYHLRALQDQAQARTLEATAQEELKTLLGADRLYVPVDSITEPDTAVFMDIDSMLALLERFNYSVRVADQVRRIARLNLYASYLSFLPRISLFYSKTLYNDSFKFDFEFFGDRAATNYGFSVALPIFELKGLIFKVLNARADARQKSYARVRAIMEAKKSLRTAYFSLQESYDRLQFAKKSYETADEAAKIAAERYALGALSLIDLLTIESSGYDARVTYVQSLTDYYVQRANLSYLIGEQER
jgi:outer membrane protein